MPWHEAMSIVEVEWVDSGLALNGWQDIQEYLDETPDVLHCKTVGYLLRSDEKRVTVLLSHNSMGNMANAMDIPRGQVVSVRVLTAGATSASGE